MSEPDRLSARLPGGSVLDDLARRVKSLADAGPARDLQRNLQAMLASAVQKMDLVTREEFDAQAALLVRTRERLESLQARVDALERAAAGSSGDGTPPPPALADGTAPR